LKLLLGTARHVLFYVFIANINIVKKERESSMRPILAGLQKHLFSISAQFSSLSTSSE
jgi:hypothetical protein